ncbi:MAG: hypothetical protein LW832_04090 [Parachlamydia sp.]|jgi:hypothetical protein|nr:hypothetical protein [Parachlamydia sp.]
MCYFKSISQKQQFEEKDLEKQEQFILAGVNSTKELLEKEKVIQLFKTEAESRYLQNVDNRNRRIQIDIATQIACKGTISEEEMNAIKAYWNLTAIPQGRDRIKCFKTHYYHLTFIDLLHQMEQLFNAEGANWQEENAQQAIENDVIIEPQRMIATYFLLIEAFKINPLYKQMKSDVTNEKLNAFDKLILKFHEIEDEEFIEPSIPTPFQNISNDVFFFDHLPNPVNFYMNKILEKDFKKLELLENLDKDK